LESKHRNNYEKKNWIDGLKGIAICGVIMVHSGMGELPGIWGKIGSIGSDGVQLFFLLSSYLTFCSMNRYFSNDISIEKGIRWIASKIIRIIPLYYLSIIIYGKYTGGSLYWLGTEEIISVLNYLSHFLLLNGLIPHYANSIIGVEWYVGCLVLFYLISPFLYKIVSNINRSIIVWVIVTFISTFGVWYIQGIIPDIPDRYIYMSYVGTFSILSQSSVWIAGILLYYVLEEKSNNNSCNKSEMLLSYILLFFGLSMMLGMAFEINKILGISYYGLCGIFFFIISYSQNMHSSVVVDNIVFRFLGRYSFPIYLIHLIVLKMYNPIVEIDFGNEIIAWLFKFAFTLCVSAAIAIPLQLFIENPIVRNLKKIIVESS